MVIPKIKNQLTGISAKEATKELKQLVQIGLIELRGQGRNAYYVPTEKLKALYGANGGTSGANGGTSGANGGTSGANGGTSGANGGTSGANGGTSGANGELPFLEDIPNSIFNRINSWGKRVPRKVISDTIEELCSIRPFSGEELAQILNRTVPHIKNKIIPHLLETKRIKFTIPEMINHPEQKYIVNKRH